MNLGNLDFEFVLWSLPSIGAHLLPCRGDFDIRISSLGYINSTNSYVRIYKHFYAKQSQFYAFIAPKRRFHEKTNPIQTQFNPKQTQLNPKQTQFKADSNPICHDVSFCEAGFVDRPKRPLISNVSPAPQLIEKLTKMLQIFKQFVNTPSFLIDKSIDYALYGYRGTLYKSKMEKVSNAH